MFLDMNSVIYNYADDNTLSYISNDINDIKAKLQHDCTKSMDWFQANNMKANADKYLLMFLSRQNSFVDTHLMFEDNKIQAMQSINILGVEVDNKLNFRTHIDNICKQAGKQINALKRIKCYMDRECKMILYNSFVSSNFNYCPIVWMFTGKLNIDNLEKSNKRAIRFVTNDNESTYESLCLREGLLYIQKRCIKAIAIQMYKIKSNTAPNYLIELFSEREMHYNVRNQNLFNLPSFNTMTYGKKSFTYYGAKLWNALPNEIKDSVSLSSFKNSLNQWLKCVENITQIDFL